MAAPQPSMADILQAFGLPQGDPSNQPTPGGVLSSYDPSVGKGAPDPDAKKPTPASFLDRLAQADPTGQAQGYLDMARGAGNAVSAIGAVPGRVAKGAYDVTPADPTQWSDEDQAKLNMGTASIANWAPQMATAMVGGGTPFAEEGAIGAAGGKLRAAKGAEATAGPVAAPETPAVYGNPQLKGSFDPTANIPLTYKGKDPSQWTPQEFKEVGDIAGVPNLGPLTKPQTYVDQTGRTFEIPGGTEGKFTYYDLLHMKAQGINPANIDRDTHAAIQQKLVNTMTPEQPSMQQNWSGLTFGMTSPNNPLFPNQLAMSRLRLRGPDPGEMLETLANQAPAELGGATTPQARLQASNQVAEQLGLGAGAKGGLGVRGSTDYSRVADLAQMFQKDPGFFQRQPGEPWQDFVERTASQIPGLKMKTGSLGTVWQDPANAATSAIDRHMVTEMDKSGALFPTPEARQAFNDRAVQRWNTTNPDRKVTDFAELQQQPAYGGFMNDMKLEEVGRTSSPKFRLASGEVNPDVPAHLANAPWVSEPKNVELMGEPYKRALDWNQQLAEQQGLSLFPSQWMEWDRIRNRLEPHENMFPGLERMPAPSVDQLRAVDAEHAASGHKDYTKVDAQGRRVVDIPAEERGATAINLKPTKARPNPAGFAYFTAPPLLAAGALGANQQQGGQ